MLVCNVSQRARRAALAAEVAEAAAAADNVLTVSFDAIVPEATSASDSVDAGVVFFTDIAEAATAADVGDGTVITSANTWNPSDLAQITLSGGNLSAQSTGTSAGVRHTTGHSTGKYYWEATTVNWGGTGTETGLATSSAALAGGGIAGQAVVTRSVGGFNGSIYINGTDSGSRLGVTSNVVVGIAVDLTAGLIWFRIAPAGSWNGSGTANPATGAGGLSLGALAGTTLLPLFAALTATEDVTANFGGSAFTGAVPSGFTSGW